MFKTNENPLGLQNSQPMLAEPIWLKLINPSSAQINQIAQQYDISADLISAGLDQYAVPRIQRKQHSTLIITHLPFENTDDCNISFCTKPFALIAQHNVVLMISQYDHPIFDRMIQHHVTTQSLHVHSYFIYRLLELGADQFIYAIKMVNQRIDDVEQELKQSIKNNQIFKLLDHNKSLNQCATSLKGNAKVLTQLRADPVFHRHPEADNLLLNVMVETQQAQAMAETHNINLCNLMDSYSAAIENNLSLLVQYLSIYVIVGAIPLGIASIYGMNIPLPLQDEPYALVILALVAVISTTAMILIFKKRQII